MIEESAVSGSAPTAITSCQSQPILGDLGNVAPQRGRLRGHRFKPESEVSRSRKLSLGDSGQRTGHGFVGEVQQPAALSATRLRPRPIVPRSASRLVGSVAIARASAAHAGPRRAHAASRRSGRRGSLPVCSDACGSHQRAKPAATPMMTAMVDHGPADSALGRCLGAELGWTPVG